MHFRSLFLTSILSTISVAVAADARDTWTDVALQSSSNVVKLNDQNFDQLITPDRNYTSIIVLTALAPQFGCSLCRDFDPEFAIVAQSWKSAYPSLDGVIFAKLDFAEGKPIFQRFGIQSAPNVWVYPPTSGPLSTLSSNNQPIVYDFPGNGMKAESFHKFLQSNINLPSFPLVRPFNWQRLFMTIFIAVTVGTAIKLAWPQIHMFITNKNTWAAISLVTILMFTSGHMFNTIRHTPYAQPNGHGGFNYIAGGFQSQFGVETQIVAGLYGILAFVTVALAIKAPAIRDPTSQSIVVWVWTAGILFIYSFLIYIFRMKNGGYPFKLFL